MYSVGDKISYPMHGAGVIEAIEEKHILEQIKRYYVLRFALGGMRVLVPVDAAERAGLRHVITTDGCDCVFSCLNAQPDMEDDANWNRRFRENRDKLKTGDVMQIACVVRGLIKRQKEKGLSSGEKRMMNQALQILISELSFASGQDPADLKNRILENG